EVNVAGGFHHQLEAAGVAEAPHRRRPEDQHTGLRNLLLQAGAGTARHGLAPWRGGPPFVEPPEEDENVAAVRAVGVQNERRSRDGHRVGNSRRLQGNLFDRVGYFDRALQRSRIGQLDVRHQVALVLDGNEPAWDAVEAQERQTDQADVDEEYN